MFNPCNLLFVSGLQIHCQLVCLKNERNYHILDSVGKLFFFKEDHFNHFFLTVHFFQEFFLNSQNWSWILFSSEFPTNKNHLLLFPGQCSHFFLMCNCSGILIIQAFVGFYNSLLVSRFLISLTVPEYQ